ncbi:MAG: hypothetical protein CVT97_03895 [Bacteroidetes bacterium HGW-Bacteroidetes-14]|jgi:O-antigen/teichoic acid export membrane protein|nr:MAG: hypothetical protein CVT97_03895 [Bacteroidetes bacterium HGW-Bacteroidetes-14]
MKIGRQDLIWNYAASFMRVASALIILPVILKMLPAEDYGLWSIMLSLKAMTDLLDFGFFPTFSRTVTYVYSGAKTLKAEGFTPVESDTEISYPLLKGLIASMKRFYGAVGFALFVLLFTAGIWYIEKILTGYTGDILSAKIAWYAYGALLAYQFYTYYYDALLVGRGMVRRSRQIMVLSQSVHIVIASVFLLLGFGIISMVAGQVVSIIVNRILAYKSFYDAKTATSIKAAVAQRWQDILRKLWNTAYKSGLSSISWVLTNRMLAAFAALYIPLSLVGNYGLSKQVAEITYTLSVVWFVTFYPKITQHRIQNNIAQVRRMYYKALMIATLVFAVCLAGVLIAGGPALSFIGSKTNFIEIQLLIVMLTASLFDGYTYISTSVLLSGNEVPHYRAQMVTAVITVSLLFMFLEFTTWGVAALVFVPFGCNLLYNHWRWSAKVMKMLSKSFS